MRRISIWLSPTDEKEIGCALHRKPNETPAPSASVYVLCKANVLMLGGCFIDGGDGAYGGFEFLGSIVAVINSCNVQDATQKFAV